MIERSYDWLNDRFSDCMAERHHMCVDMTVFLLTSLFSLLDSHAQEEIIIGEFHDIMFHFQQCVRICRHHMFFPSSWLSYFGYMILLRMKFNFSDQLPGYGWLFGWGFSYMFTRSCWELTPVPDVEWSEDISFYEELKRNKVPVVPVKPPGASKARWKLMEWNPWNWKNDGTSEISEVNRNI